MSQTLFKNANIFTPVDSGHAQSGKKQDRLLHYHKGSLLIENEKIAAIGSQYHVEKHIDNTAPLKKSMFKGDA